MSRWWARSRWRTGAISTGCAWSGGRRGRRPGPRTSSSPCSASTAAWRPASRCARSMPPTTRATGSNGQVYNRCVGTRYCGNNCPYHVRRFNWFYYHWPSPLDLQLNPDVTVRQLGVMEKCTMCLQRIVEGKDQARDAGRPVKDGEIKTACQQTCPTQAITFGDLKDDKAQVSKLSRSRARLPRAGRARHPPRGDLSQEGGAGARRAGGGRPQGMSAPGPTREVTWAGRQPGRHPHRGDARQYLLLLDDRHRPHAGVRRRRVDLPDLHGHGRGGQAHAADVGDVHHHLRVLDRYRARGHPDLRRALSVPGEVAHIDLPRRGGHDHLRGHDRGALPPRPRGPGVVRLLAHAVSRISATCGRTSSRRWCGTCSRSRPT